MKITRQLQKTVSRLVDISFKDGRIVEKEVVKCIKILKTLPTNKAIFASLQFLKELRRKERAHTMYIETAIPLSPTQVQKAKKIVAKNNKITKVLVNINPEILGGFKLKIGDEIWDESVKGKIEQIKEAIIRG